MTSAGRYGWYTDAHGYRYETATPPAARGRRSRPPSSPSGAPWCRGSATPDCCLVNYYAATARMGLHRDADEADFSWPVLSISLGDPALFRVGGTTRKDPTATILLESGDVVVFGGPARLAYHGIDRVRFGASRLLPDGGRINLTLRVVD